MARITCEDCLDAIGDDNRFNLIHLTVKRIRQHRQGAPFLAEGKNQEVVMTLREIADGAVSFENVETLAGAAAGSADSDDSRRGDAAAV